MLKYLLLLALATISLNASAYSKESLVNFYKAYFYDQLGIGFEKRDYQIGDKLLRKSLLTYIKQNKLAVSLEDFYIHWQDFVDKNFSSEAKLKSYIRNTYSDIETAKAKFHNDLNLKHYYEAFVKKSVEADLDFRESALTSETITVTETELIEAKNQILRNLKLTDISQANERYGISEEDLLFLVKSNIVFSKSLQDNKNSSLDNRIENLLSNSKLSKEEAREKVLKNYRRKISYLKTMF